MSKAIHAVTMPKWGIEMTEGTITRWRIAEGERIARGAEILDVETEKIVNAVEAPMGGVLRRIVAHDGETHPVGVLLGVIAEDTTTDAEVTRFIDSFVAAVVTFDLDPEAAPVALAEVPSAGTTGAGPSTDGANGGAGGALAEDARVSPIARRIAERLGVDLARVTGTGRNGRISKEDVEAFAARLAGAPPAVVAVPALAALHSTAALHAVRRVPMSARRGVIARRLREAKQLIPHYRLTVDVDFGALLQRRRERAAHLGKKASVNDWLLRAAALALAEHPMLNAQLDGEDILQFANADIAIAVAVEEGLVAPILREANLKSIEAIAEESRRLIERARDGTLERHEITGGTFTVSNLGTQGIKQFDAIINAPQVAILAAGSIDKRAVVRSGLIAVADIATLTLSADHRVVDGAVGAAFMATLTRLLEHPSMLETSH